MSGDARTLDANFLAMVAGWARGGAGCDEAAFDAHARALFAYQIERNAPYARFAASQGFGPNRLPATWREIPAVPAAAFKDATLATFDVRHAERTFRTSGTTVGTSGFHYLERTALYDAALLAGFDRFILPDGARLRYLLLAPNPRDRADSSLGYMLGHVSVLRGDGRAGWFLQDERVDVPGFSDALRACERDGQPVCIAGTAFAFVALLDALDADGTRFLAPPGSRVMETGGFKGRTRTVERAELYARLAATLGVEQRAIVAEYGMTELVSQYYDSPASRERDVRVKVSPPWLRALLVDADGAEIREPGVTGSLRHVDLGNRSSVVAVETEDRGVLHGDGFVLLGRDADAAPRGCSLDAEALLVGR